MDANKIVTAITLGIILTAFAPGAFSQQTVYKWVDKDGVVHFGDTPPEGTEAPDTVNIPASPEPPPATSSTAPAALAAPVESPPPPAVPENSTPVAKVDISEMSLPDLDRRCEEAREKEIAPLRETEIAKCKEDKRNEADWCERFNADYGDGGRTVSGAIRPRMFDDLPECVDAQQERHRRGR